jgi:hypothetical protein
MEKYVEAEDKLKEAISLGLPPDFEGQAGPSPLSVGRRPLQTRRLFKRKATAGKRRHDRSERLIKKAGIGRRLECTCVGLGLTAEAERYGKLARSS